MNGVKVVECSFLFYDQQSYVGNDIEKQKEYFEQPDKRINNYVERFPRKGEPFALRTIYQIRGENQHYSPEEQQGSVYD